MLYQPNSGVQYQTHQVGPPACAMEHQSLIQAVRQLLLSNVRDGYSRLLGQHYCYITPSPKTYPFQWFWDTFFHVMILTRVGECELAKRNLRSLFAMQSQDGFVGHMIFWNQLLPKRRTDVLQAQPSWETLRPHMSSLIQPTFAAVSLLRLFEATGDRVFLGEMYAPIKRYHEWLAQHRDFDGDGLLTIISPFESGMDWKPCYDLVLGYHRRSTPNRLYFNSLFWKGVAVDFSNFIRQYDLARIKRRAKFLVKDAGVNAIYANDLAAMETLAGLIGDNHAKIYLKRRKRVVNSLMEKMYDDADAAFYDLQEPGSKKIRIATPTIFFPLILDDIPQSVADRVIAKHFYENGVFDCPIPLPSVARNDAAFFAAESPFIWRGPTWAFINWFLFHTMKRRGYEEHANRLRDALCTAIARGGFREYYNPFNGDGYGAPNFTWSGLVADMT
jgi:glycogen debranching enzyme